jgi:CelD/BcsL family acetyltransferase involved in cellulose biosynthesis
LEIEVLRPQELSASRVARWAELQAADIVLDSPFLSPQWARAVEQSQSKSAHEFRVVVGRENGRDVAFLPLRAGGATAMPVGAPMCDYQGVVAEAGVEIDPRAFIRAAGVQRFDFSCMLESQAAFAPFARGHDLIHVIDVANGYDAYAAERKEAGSGALKDLDKKRRKVERELGEVRFTAHSRSRAEFDQLVAWKSAQFGATGQTDIFKAGWTRRLIGDLFESRDPDFGAILFTLHIGDRLAAAHLHMRGRRTIHGWLISHDHEFDRYSPGVLLFQDILRWMDGTPYQRLDLGPGDYQFKRQLANAGQYVTHGFVGLASPAALLREAAYGVRAAMEALPLGKASELPGKAMRRLDVIRGLN